MAPCSFVCIPPDSLARVREDGLSMILIAPYWPSKHWLTEITQLLIPGAMASANTQGPAVSGAQRNISSPHRESGSVGLGREWFKQKTMGLPLGMMETK